jgi:hypothetical protein
MTKIYIYCLFDRFDNFLGVYSSLKAVHRDAMKVCNNGYSSVRIVAGAHAQECSLSALRNIFKGKCDHEIKYQSDTQIVKVFKTKLKE